MTLAINWRSWLPYLGCVLAGVVLHVAWEHWRPAPVPPPAPSPEIVLPAPFSLRIGEGRQVQAQTAGKLVKFKSHDGLRVQQYTDLSAWVSAEKSGTYKLWAWSAIDALPTEAYWVVVTVAGPDPVPPGPGPGPGPTPEPTDPLWAVLKPAFQADGGDAAKAKTLAAVYRQALPKMSGFKTCKEFIGVCHTAAEGVLAGALLKTRRVLADELNKVNPVQDATPLDADRQAKYTEQFNRFAGLLEVLK